MSVWGEPGGQVQYNYAAADTAAAWVNEGARYQNKQLLSFLDSLELAWCSCRECDDCMSAPFARREFTTIRAFINGENE